MIVKVLFFGVLREATGFAEDLAEVPNGLTIAGLYGHYSERFGTLSELRPSILFAKNQEFVSSDTTVEPNDEVAFLPPVSGGSGPARDELESFSRHTDGHLFGLTRKVIDRERMAAELTRPEDGAVVIFDGVVRNNTKGRPTVYLEYECYAAMALKQMEQIGLEIAKSCELGRIGMVHRLGRLDIGEASVVIVATSPHRKAAFQGAQMAIDRLKREVPIWKKEHFADGEVWVQGEWDEQLKSRVS